MNTIKALLRGKYIILSAHINNLEKSHTLHLNNTPEISRIKISKFTRRSRQQEIILLRVEIYKIETKRAI